MLFCDNFRVLRTTMFTFSHTPYTQGDTTHAPDLQAPNPQLQLTSLRNADTPTVTTNEYLIAKLQQLETRLMQAEQRVNQPLSSTPNHPLTRGEFLAAQMLKPPKFYGYDDPKQPSQFITEYERFMRVNSHIPQEEYLTKYLWAAMEGDALRWYNFLHTEFTSWNKFCRLFMDKFADINYQDKLKEEIYNRTQHFSEPLSDYIQAMQGYFELTYRYYSQQERIKIVMRNMHPAYLDYMQHPFRDLLDMYYAALDAQKRVSRNLTYRPPPNPKNSIEPSLAFTPHNPEDRIYRDDPPRDQQRNQSTLPSYYNTTTKEAPSKKQRLSHDHPSTTTPQVIQAPPNTMTPLSISLRVSLITRQPHTTREIYAT